MSGCVGRRMGGEQWCKPHWGCGRVITLETEGTGSEDPAAKQSKRQSASSVPTHGSLISRVVHGLVVVALVLAITVAVKFVLGLVMAADAHVFNLLKAKLGSYEDYDTALYVPQQGPHGVFASSLTTAECSSMCP